MSKDPDVVMIGGTIPVSRALAEELRADGILTFGDPWFANIPGLKRMGEISLSGYWDDGDDLRDVTVIPSRDGITPVLGGPFCIFDPGHRYDRMEVGLDKN